MQDRDSEIWREKNYLAEKLTRAGIFYNAVHTLLGQLERTYPIRDISVFLLKTKVQLKYSWLGINMTCDVCTITRDMDIAYRESILPPSCIYKQSQHHVIIVLGAALASLGKYSLQSPTPRFTKHLLNPNLYSC